MYVDSPYKYKGYGLRLDTLMVLPQGMHVLIPVKLDPEVTNSVTTYEACFIEMQVA